MRERSPRPKIQETVVIPRELKSFLADVHMLIVEGDESTTIESDDLLQCERACGGLLEEGRDVYGFTFFTDPEGVRNKWEIVLSKADIEKVANATLTEFSLWACQDAACGCKFSSEDETCFYCDYVDMS